LIHDNGSRRDSQFVHNLVRVHGQREWIARQGDGLLLCYGTNRLLEHTVEGQSRCGALIEVPLQLSCLQNVDII
jgi:hypothetical protein